VLYNTYIRPEQSTAPTPCYAFFASTSLFNSIAYSLHLGHILFRILVTATTPAFVTVAARFVRQKAIQQLNRPLKEKPAKPLQKNLRGRALA